MKRVLDSLPPTWSAIGIPEAFTSTVIDPYSPRGLVARGKDAVVSGKNVYLWGPIGTGKTFVACYWAACFVKEKMGVVNGLPKFVVMPDLFDAIKDSWVDSSTKRVLAPFLKAPLLVLDNYGRGSNTDWAKDEFFKIINHRYNKNLPVVITSILSPDKFETNDPDSASRVLGGGLVLQMKGGDRRK